MGNGTKCYKPFLLHCTNHDINKWTGVQMGHTTHVFMYKAWNICSSIEFINNSWMLRLKEQALVMYVFLASDCAFHDRRIPIPVSLP